MSHFLLKLRSNLPKLVLSLLALCLAFGVSGLQPLASLAADPNGSVVDPTFLSGSGPNTTVFALALQPDGKVLIGGGFITYNSTSRNRIARLNADGSLDTSFNPGSGASNTVSALALQQDGKVLIGGQFDTYNGTGRLNIARLNADGSLDTSFNPGSGTDGIVNAIKVQADGKILIGGGFTNYNGTPRNRIARLNADGTLDTSFDPNVGPNASVRTIAVQPDGKILIGGNFNRYNGTPRGFIARLNADGTLDTSFLNPGTGANSFVNAIKVLGNGKILVGAGFSIFRLNSDGSLDATFNPGTGANGGVRAIAVQSDDKILIGGTFTAYNGRGRNYIARLNADGSLDTNFLDSSTGANNIVRAIAVQSDGKILIGGLFTDYNGTPRNRIARLNADGALDTSFDPRAGVDISVEVITL